MQCPSLWHWYQPHTRIAVTTSCREQIHREVQVSSEGGSWRGDGVAGQGVLSPGPAAWSGQSSFQGPR